MAKIAIIICALTVAVQGFGRTPEEIKEQRKKTLEAMVNCPDNEKVDAEEFSHFMENHKSGEELPEKYGCFFKCTMQQKLDGCIAYMEEDGTITVTDVVPEDHRSQAQECANNLHCKDLCKKARNFFQNCVNMY